MFKAKIPIMYKPRLMFCPSLRKIKERRIYCLLSIMLGEKRINREEIDIGSKDMKTGPWN